MNGIVKGNTVIMGATKQYVLPFVQSSGFFVYSIREHVKVTRIHPKTRRADGADVTESATYPMIRALMY